MNKYSIEWIVDQVEKNTPWAQTMKWKDAKTKKVVMESWKQYVQQKKRMA